MGKCDKGYQGECCCGCVNRMKLHRHCCVDKKESEDGCICSQQVEINNDPMWVCIIDIKMGGDRANLSHEHGCCELWESKK